MDRCHPVALLQEELAPEAHLPPVALQPRVAVQPWVALRPQLAASQAQAARTDRLADGQAMRWVAMRQVALRILTQVALLKRAVQSALKQALALMRELQVLAAWA